MDHMTSRPGEGKDSLETNNKVQGLLPRLGQQLRGLMNQVLGQQAKAPMQSLLPLPVEDSVHSSDRTPEMDALKMLARKLPDSTSAGVQYIPHQLRDEQKLQQAELADLGLNSSQVTDTDAAQIRYAQGPTGIGADQKTDSSNLVQFPSKAA